ncbi:hypothetical protein B0A55_12857 [Friedmanniomyces simplex]|uniref:Uncharacterized protein n=1 Tax=Friedmanniomyces simplex TaxID=329884 RepID=A0A4U0VIY0_9PEZI|nr:hypothetical protein B0A55_12857 [Friedmanniomyces simplex]
MALHRTNWASALLELRGKDQLNTELGRHLFEYLRIQILSRCALTRSPTPDVVIELSEECRKYGRNDADDLILISNSLDQLRSERPFHPRDGDSEIVDRDVMCRCASLAAELRAWRLAVAPAFSPFSVDNKTPRLAAFGEYKVVYSDDRTAGLLNQCHRLAILVDELAITRHLNLQRKGLLARHDIFSLQNLRLDLIEHVHAICASVPRLLKSGRIEAAKGLLWPLYVAAQLNPRTVTLEFTTRQWIVEQLRTIGFGKGVRQAIFLVDVLVNEQEVTELMTELMTEDHGNENEAE